MKRPTFTLVLSCKLQYLNAVCVGIESASTRIRVLDPGLNTTSGLNWPDAVRLGRTASQIKCRRSCKNPARNLPSPACNLTNPGRPSEIGNSHIDRLPLHNANSIAAKLPLLAQDQDASSLHKCVSSIWVLVLSSPPPPSGRMMITNDRLTRLI